MPTIVHAFYIALLTLAGITAYNIIFPRGFRGFYKSGSLESKLQRGHRIIDLGHTRLGYYDSALGNDLVSGREKLSDDVDSMHVRYDHELDELQKVKRRIA